MRYKINLTLAFVLLTALCWIDYQYFTEGAQVNAIPGLYRQAMHFVILAALIPVGYFGWRKHPLSWMKKLWLLPYVAVLLLIGAAGLIQWKWDLFSIEILDIISMIRLFFCSPMPYLILYLFSIMVQKDDLATENREALPPQK